MLDDFLIRAALAGGLLALAAGPLGCFVVWRRMAYFGDATAHAAILGVALALATDLPVGLGTLTVAMGMALTVATLSARGWAMDTTLGVLAHSALAFGLLAASFVPEARTDLSAYLFGDMLAVSRTELAFIWRGALPGHTALVGIALLIIGVVLGVRAFRPARDSRDSQDSRQAEAERESPVQPVREP